MALLDRQTRQAVIGRIRMGTSVPGDRGGRRAVRLSTFRFTSASQTAIRMVATCYGGEPRPWTEGAPTPGLWEVITLESEVAVAVAPGWPILFQDYELWDCKGIRRRLCDGLTERLHGARPCVCREETEGIPDPVRQCKPTSRLCVILPDVPGAGMWMLNTRGETAADELAGVAQVLQAHAALGGMLPAVLRMEQRVTKTDEGTSLYPVPVLMLTQTMRELAGRAQGSVELPAPPPALLAIAAARRDELDPPYEDEPPYEVPPRFEVERPTDPEHLARMIESCPPDLAWIADVRSRARRQGWLDSWVSTRFSDAMARVREVLDWRAEEINAKSGDGD